MNAPFSHTSMRSKLEVHGYIPFLVKFCNEDNNNITTNLFPNKHEKNSTDRKKAFEQIIFLFLSVLLELLEALLLATF